MKHRRILISSAEANVRRAIRRAVEPSQHPLVVDETAEAVPSGPHRYDIIVFDIDRHEGIERLTSLLSVRGGPQILVLASRSHLEEALHAVRLGASDVLEKPATPQEIAAAIEEALARPSGLLRLVLFPRRTARRSPPSVASGAFPASGRTDGSTNSPVARASEPGAGEPACSYLECLARARSAMGRHDEAAARRWIRAGLSIDTERPEAYNLLGIVSEMEQDVPQAMKYYRAAVALDPMYEPPRNNLHRITGVRVNASRDIGAVESSRNENQE